MTIGGGLRSPTAFIQLMPGVLGSGNDNRVAGGLSNGESYRLDGAESQSERRNDPSFNAVSVEALEEFKVQAGAYSAEFGRTSNGVVNFVTKSGTNELHGSAFLFNRNEFFNARGYTFTATRRAVSRQWNPGGSIGGPIYIPKLFDGRNKAFFFFAYETVLLEDRTSDQPGYGAHGRLSQRRHAQLCGRERQTDSAIRPLRCSRKHHPGRILAPPFVHATAC